MKLVEEHTPDHRSAQQLAGVILDHDVYTHAGGTVKFKELLRQARYPKDVYQTEKHSPVLSRLLNTLFLTPPLTRTEKIEFEEHAIPALEESKRMFGGIHDGLETVAIPPDQNKVALANLDKISDLMDKLAHKLDAKLKGRNTGILR